MSLDRHLLKLVSVAGPTPGSLRTGKGSRNDLDSLGGTTVKPSGLSKSEAILAIKLVGCHPDAHGQTSFVATRRLTSVARAVRTTPLVQVSVRRERPRRSRPAGYPGEFAKNSNTRSDSACSGEIRPNEDRVRT